MVRKLQFYLSCSLPVKLRNFKPEFLMGLNGLKQVNWHKIEILNHPGLLGLDLSKFWSFVDIGVDLNSVKVEL